MATNANRPSTAADTNPSDGAGRPSERCSLAPADCQRVNDLLAPLSAGDTLTIRDPDAEVLDVIVTDIEQHPCREPACRGVSTMVRYCVGGYVPQQGRIGEYTACLLAGPTRLISTTSRHPHGAAPWTPDQAARLIPAIRTAIHEHAATRRATEPDRDADWWLASRSEQAALRSFAKRRAATEPDLADPMRLPAWLQAWMHAEYRRHFTQPGRPPQADRIVR